MNENAEALCRFLRSHEPSLVQEVLWPEFRFEVGYHLGVEASALRSVLGYVTSVRAVVLGDAGVLVLRNPHEVHILPGGRREPGESLIETLRREVAEETGWCLGEERMLGVMRFRHLNPKPEGYAYPYPSFLQVVYAARAERQTLRQEEDAWEVEAGFVSLEGVECLELKAGYRLFLKAATEVDFEKAVAER